MNKKLKLMSLGIAALTLFLATHAYSQTDQQKLLKRTRFQTQNLEFGPGGTIVIIGTPKGSITVEGWERNEVEVSAVIEVEGYSEEDLDKLSAVTGFVIDRSVTKLSVVSVGTHDRKYLKKFAKDLPKRLRHLPFRVNYTLKVPFFSDLEIDGGSGDLLLNRVEGSMSIKFVESNARLILAGGSVQATIGKGDVDVVIATRSWRGRFAEVQLASGNLTLNLPKNLNANLTARVLRGGSVENSYSALKPKDKMNFTDNELSAVAGSGGAELSFIVGEGTLKINDLDQPARASN